LIGEAMENLVAGRGSIVHVAGAVKSDHRWPQAANLAIIYLEF